MRWFQRIFAFSDTVCCGLYFLYLSPINVLQ